MTDIGTPSAALAFRTAVAADVPALVRMLADDPIGATRESAAEPLDAGYISAFDAIARDPNNELLLAERGGAIVAVVQITFIPSLTYRGSWRAQLEGVRVAAGARGGGIGRALIEAAIDRARARGCRLVQLTSDQRRPDAIRFYEQLGFRTTHAGMKLALGER